MSIHHSLAVTDYMYIILRQNGCVHVPSRKIEGYVHDPSHSGVFSPFFVGVGFLVVRFLLIVVHVSPPLTQQLADVRDTHVGMLILQLMYVQ